MRQPGLWSLQTRKNLYDALLTKHTYLTLTGLLLLHPLTIFKYKGFPPDKITKIKEAILTYN